LRDVRDADIAQTFPHADHAGVSGPEAAGNPRPPPVPDGQIETSSAECMVRAPLVSVLMITYNHAEYLAESILGVVSQVCEFPIELIIGEDASTDATRSIALDFQKRYPETIRVVHSSANVGMIANSRRIFALARGEFVAYCEGDDYWCSKRKLSLQVEALRANPRAAVVHSDWVRSKPDGNAWNVEWRKSVHGRIPLRLLQGEIFATFHYPKILRTCTTLHRRDSIAEFLASPLASKRYRFGDTVRTAYQTSRWQVAYVPAVTAVYRESAGSALRSGKLARLSFLLSCLEFDEDARAFFKDRKDYPAGYRWETSVGLLVKALLARQYDTARLALRDIRAHFSVIGFLKTGLETVAMRMPTLLRHERIVP
jgi:glycosyltransferase involved in cell wall biosynthesis